MIWEKVKSYKTVRKTGDPILMSGISNGYFAIDFGCSLTHLASGMLVAEFSREDDAKRVADYLTERYGNELAAVKKAIGRRKLSARHIKALPEMQDFLNACKADFVFLQMLDELKYRKEENPDEQ